MKIVIILDFKARNALNNPSDKQLREFSHSITNMYEAIKKMAEARSITEGWFEPNTKQGELLATLSEFAQASRYYNIDQIVSGRENPDPLTRWFAVHMQIAHDAISYKWRNHIMEQARNHCEARGLLGYEMGPTGQYDLTIDVTYQLEIARISRGHCVWAIIEILEPIYRLIDRLTAAVHNLEIQSGIEPPNVPFMYEFFPFCLAMKSTAVKRKLWTTLFHIAGRM